MNFEFATANRIVFGQGAARDLPSLAASIGRRPCIVSGNNPQRHAHLFDDLRSHNLHSTPFTIDGEPTTQTIRAGIAVARRHRSDLVIAIGGGSVIDAAKVIAALLTNTGDPFDYLEIIGQAKPLQKSSAPCIAIPTTAGTGAEVTRNSVIASPDHQVKVSMRSPFMLPSVALVDPELTLSMPPPLTASTGLDALTQLMEAFVSKKANPLTDGICREGMARAGRSLRKAFRDGNNVTAREDMSLASLFGGLALANAGLGAIHGFAAPIGGMYAAPHGAVCGRLLPWVLAANIQALEQRNPSAPALVRYSELAQILTGRTNAGAQDGISWIEDLCAELASTPLQTFSIKPKDFPDIVRKAQQASSMKGNPIALTDEELTTILHKAL